MTERDTAKLLREALEARDRLAQQSVELELQAQLLQDQASEMEAQQVELEQQTEELQCANEELHQAIEQLHASERFVSGVLAAIADPFVVHDADWRFRYVNEAAARVFSQAGRSGPALVGSVLWEVYPDIVGTNFERQMRRASETRTPVVFEELYQRAGTWAEIRCYPLPDGGVATLWKDTTDKKRAEETIHYLTRASEILSSSLEYEKTVQSLADLIVPRLADWCAVDLVEDADHIRRIAVAHVDPAKVAWAHELNDRYPVKLSDPRGLGNVLRTGRSELYADITDEMLVAGARDAEHLRITRDLAIRAVIYVPIFSRGAVIGVMTLVAAESGRRYTDADVVLAQELARRAGTAIGKARLYEQAVAARAEAEQANRAKGQFLAHMSHELRTPLNAIGGYAQLLQIGVHGPVNAAQEEALERIQRSQRHLLGLINDVLNFAKLEAGHVGYHLTEVKIADMVCGLEPLVAPQLAAKSLGYDCIPIPPDLTALADAEKLQQIMLNLLSNAIKFTPSGGHVRVTAVALGNAVSITVSDTGIGIPSDRFDAIFEPFVQLARSTTGGTATGQEGTGLGLAISRDLARAMGGDLTVRSTLGEGSVFELRIPRA